MDWNSPVGELKGVGEKTEKLFQFVGVFTLADLLRYYPRGYESFDEPAPICEIEAEGIYTVRGILKGSVQQKRTGRRVITAAQLTDGSAVLKVTWFNIPYLRTQLKPGQIFILRGKVTCKKGGAVLEQPLIYSEESYAGVSGCLQPLYPLTLGLKQGMVRKAVRQAIGCVTPQIDYLPGWVRKKYELADPQYALEKIHFPEDEHELMLARRRLVFEEFFFFILCVRKLKEHSEDKKDGWGISPSKITDDFMNRLPFALTGAQNRVWEEIRKDLNGGRVMNRLIQGDVGSGKTVLAALALLEVVSNGYQGAMMAPTEVLARQHAGTLTAVFNQAGTPVRIVLLTGSMGVKERRLANEKITDGEADIIVGTHALIQETVNFKSLALVITDEQHRFGVRQREILSEKGKEAGGREPHILVMSATPIPRTLAIIIYGDLDISIVDELPANRLPIKNCVVNTAYRPTAYRFIYAEVLKGRQAYIICPMVEESEAIEAENVIDYTEKLRTALPDYKIEYLHGKMKPKEKNAVMEAFKEGRIQILVSTTVIEVGVDVPNATVMMIENAERFGLAQLHQLRGRVGRGAEQSYCIFVNTSDSRENKRLEILNHSNDGFKIASEDLKLRGPGDMFGIHQSGDFEFSIGDIYADASILKQASEAVQAILTEDAAMQEEENRVLKRRFEQYMKERTERLSL